MVDRYQDRIRGVYDAHSMPIVYPVPLIGVAEALGYIVRDFVLTPENRSISGAVMYKEKKILLNPSEYERRKNFTLAHELGHIILGHGKDRDSEYDTRDTIWNSDKNSREYDVYELATELMMPAKEFLKEWERCHDVAELADTFQVLIIEAKKRLDMLGINFMGGE